MKSKKSLILIIAIVFTLGLSIIFMAIKANQGRNFSGPVSDGISRAAVAISNDTNNNTDLVKTISTPGVYVEEIPNHIRPIIGVETSVAGFIGITERGPLEPHLITSFSQFKDIYGEYLSDSYLAYSVEGFFDNQGEKLYVARVTSKDSQTAKREIIDGKKLLATIEAISPGIWGNGVSVIMSTGLNSKKDDPTYKLEVNYDNNISSDSGLKRSARVQPAAKITEIFEDVSFSETSSYSYKKTINTKSKLIRIDLKSKIIRSIPINDKEPIFLTKGFDGSSVQLSDYIGDSGQNGQPPKGLKALGDIDEITILYSPGAQDVPGLNQAMINQCESMKDRIVLIDTALGDDKNSQTTEYDSSYASVYSPWLSIFDPVTLKSKLIPPGGFIAGTYVKTDNTRGVNKAPANVPIQGVTGLERDISRGEQDEYLYKKINPIVNINARGIMACGIRTLSSDEEYKYINIRRYVNHIRESISDGFQWCKYEPWNATVESNIKTSLSNFLNKEWTNGALVGNSTRDAYFINVYRMKKPGESEDMITVIEVGLALIKPTEFHIIRMSFY